MLFWMFLFWLMKFTQLTHENCVYTMQQGLCTMSVYFRKQFDQYNQVQFYIFAGWTVEYSGCVTLCVWMYLIHRYVLQDWSDNDEIREQRGQPILTMSGMMQTVDKLFSASSLDNVRGTAYSIHINHSVTCYCKNEFLFKTFYSKSAFVSMDIFLFLHLLRIQCEQYDSCS